ncbi:MAG: efflux RND transporter periplasmic adaptor subunit [Deltaproteobacteria bacterium]|nr:efflux RND transporter periplasmic adaptor subunit [Deltaproteobacteria bacterium]
MSSRFHGVLSFLSIFALALPLAGCVERAAHGETANSAEAAHGDHDDHAGHDHGAVPADAPKDACCPAGEHGGHGQAEHGEAEKGHDEHGHAEGSDLDRPADELFAARCEHSMPTHQCDECRYEVGVARVAADLIADGLVRVESVTARKLDAPIRLTGEVRFDERRVAHLAPVVSGSIRRVLVDVGERVRAGQPLVELDSADLAGTQGAALEAASALRLAEREYERQRELRNANVASEKEYLNARENLESARARSSAATRTLAGMGGGAGRYVLRAPIAGSVLDLHAVTGEFVESGREIMLIGDTDALWVWVDLFEKHLDAVSTAQRTGNATATVRVDAYPGETFVGTLDVVGQVMDEASRTVKARVTLPNPGGRLRPGMFADVSLHPEGARDALAVPATAVQSDEGRDFVFVRHEGDYFVRRPVTKGISNGDFLEVAGGLSPGQEIVTVGAFLLKSDVLRSKMGAGCAD